MATTEMIESQLATVREAYAVECKQRIELQGQLKRALADIAAKAVEIEALEARSADLNIKTRELLKAEERIREMEDDIGNLKSRIRGCEYEHQQIKDALTSTLADADTVRDENLKLVERLKTAEPDAQEGFVYIKEDEMEDHINVLAELAQCQEEKKTLQQDHIRRDFEFVKLRNRIDELTDQLTQADPENLRVALEASEGESERWAGLHAEAARESERWEQLQSETGAALKEAEGRLGAYAKDFEELQADRVGLAETLSKMFNLIEAELTTEDGIRGYNAHYLAYIAGKALAGPDEQS